jgi:septal ring factor EnvC (AmiA/AmiB activator)
MEELYSPSLKSQKDCRSLQQKAQEEMQETSKLLEDTEKHLGTLQDCQSKLSTEEQQVQSQIDEIVLKINTLSEEREAITEQKVCCMCHLLPAISLVARPQASTLSLPESSTGHDPEPLPVTCQHHRASFPEFHLNGFFPGP